PRTFCRRLTQRHHEHAHDAAEPCAEEECHALSSFASAISTSTRSGSPCIAYTCSATTCRSSAYATPLSPSMIDFAALSMSALLRPFEYSHSLSATGPSIIVTPAARASHATRSSYSRV